MVGGDDRDDDLRNATIFEVYSRMARQGFMI